MNHNDRAMLEVLRKLAAARLATRQAREVLEATKTTKNVPVLQQNLAVTYATVSDFDYSGKAGVEWARVGKQGHAVEQEFNALLMAWSKDEDVTYAKLNWDKP